MPAKFTISESAPESLELHQQQQTLSGLLEQSKSLDSLKTGLQNSSLASTDWNVENWAPEMLGTAYKIAQKWKRGFE